MPKPRRWRKDFPYYKIQVFNETVQSWKDERKIFQTIDAAADYIRQEIAPRRARIMVVERTGRHVLTS
jgi:cytochrome P450